MIKEFYIDPKGGRHYHLKDCPMVSHEIPPHFNYEPIKRRVYTYNGKVHYHFYLLVGDKKYIPCSCIKKETR